jgi:hypothetical protein
MRVEMLDKNKRHAGISWQGLQELAERLKPAGRCPYSNDEALLGVCGNSARRLAFLNILLIAGAPLLRLGISAIRRVALWGFIYLGHMTPF